LHEKLFFIHPVRAARACKNIYFEAYLIVRVFKNKWFNRFADKNGITDDDLKDILSDLENGLVNANLGGDVYKKRVARPGAGKSGGYRTIVFFKSEFRTFFVYGFAKSDRDNIKVWELEHYKEDAKDVFALTEEVITARLKKGSLLEIITEAKNGQKI
jgi:hypothetical protein